MGRPKKLNNEINSTKKDGTLSEIKVDNDSKNTKIVTRRKRIPLREQSRLMRIPNKNPDNYYRIVNGESLDAYLDAGYEILDKQGREIDRDIRIQDPSYRHSALSQPVGGGEIGYAVSIPKKIWEEDQLAEEKIRLKSEGKYGKVDKVSDEFTYREVEIKHSDKF